MPEISLQARAGREVGSRPSRRLRAAGQVPAILYGQGVEPLALSVDGRELRAALSTPSGANALINLSAGTTTQLAMAKELQRHPLRQSLLHVDFVVVRRDQVVATEVPVVLVGDAEAVRLADGVVEQQVFALAVRALPADIPTAFAVDVSALEVGQAIRVGDLTLPPGVEVGTDPDTVIVVAQGAQVPDLGKPAEPAEPAEPGSAAGEG